MNIDPPVWELVEHHARNNDEFCACLLALRARIEALENARPVRVQMPSSLVGSLAAIIDNGTACDRGSERIAKDAICAVADWFNSEGCPLSAAMIADEIPQ
jgi:hypothetical protein